MSFIIQNTIYTAVICIGWIHANAGQAAATRKRTVSIHGAPNACDAGRDADAGQAAATRKRIGSDACDGIGDGEGTGFTCRVLNQGGLGFVIQNTIYTAVIRIAWIHANAGQAAATRKRIVSDAGDAGRNGDAGQAAAIGKRIISNGGDAGRDADAGQAVAIRKRIVPNAGDAGRDNNIGQAAAIIKRIISNGGDGIGDGDGTGFTCRALDQGGLGFVVEDATRTAIICIA